MELGLDLSPSGEVLVCIELKDAILVLGLFAAWLLRECNSQGVRVVFTDEWL